MKIYFLKNSLKFALALLLIAFTKLGSLAQNDSFPSRLTVGYDIEKHPYFDGYTATIEYGRKFNFGTAIGKLQNVSRFDKTSSVEQIEFYPKFGKSSYGYTSLMITDGTILPKVNFAASWMPILKGGVELQVGGNFIYVSPTEQAWLGIFGVTKYLKNWYFNSRIYLASGNNLSGKTATFTVRRYAKDDVSYLWLTTGISKTDQTTSYQNILFNTFQLNARWLQVGLHQKIDKHWAIDVGGGFENFDSQNSETKRRWLTNTSLHYIFK